ncbi:uncharacterized protein [Elaeis guineensis]|uniref:Uncharacterized protein LOC105045653 n=1 Tax=Elaeis guineensis var. tenera TaxID=51953 RepID=A0A6J0PI34_ELAGV|nr:uncharacterized protein LOC105045653 [Elaeis guineensis]XP_010922310.1 uncharacterized protein LOC105045653 [Elaeis guineensis]XP_019705925.1 uncharacterized protein LOC105045653 [Elaeis guineensis]XP_019705926.1 uncharacterized protein LOC105045653 [Elaeis guineensis]
MAKAKGKEKPAASDAPPKLETTNDDTNAELTLSESVNMEKAAKITADPGGQKAEEGHKKKDIEEERKEDTEEDKKEKVYKCNKEEVEGDKEVKDGEVEALVFTSVALQNEEVDEADTEVKVDGKVEAAFIKKAKRTKKRRKKKGVAGTAASVNADKPGTSASEKDLKKTDGMGLIFMCNAKTRKDCYQFKVLGLPASKKEIVAKVYKGMRLFLFDVDLKLMYGIYKAASPGGYNIEPKAFKSKFPSQVRFTVLDDCLPLPEEKFKAVIKVNYYEKNKFNCQLSHEQVKNLCKLFRNTTKASKQKRRDEVSREGLSSINEIQRRRLSYGILQHSTVDGSDPRIPKGTNLYARESYASQPQHVGLYARKAYVSPPRPAALPPPVPAPIYAHDQRVDDYYYRRGPVLETHDYRTMDVEMRLRAPIEYRDPYSLYRELVPYRETPYTAGQEAQYSAGLQASYAPFRSRY